jgi:DNA-binding IclR family transcriptional regulator
MANINTKIKKRALEENIFNGDVKEEYIVSSLVRGLQILSTFTTEKPALKVSDIAEINGFDQATVFRFVYTLEKLGYLVRDEETKKYRLSVKMLTLSLPARTGLAVRNAALPLMSELSKKVSETVRLAILDKLEIVNIATNEFPDRLYFRTRIGDRSPVFGTALGKVLLAYQPIETWKQLISQIKFIPHTEQTIVDPELFREELLKIRQQGYAIQDGELVEGICSIAAPIFDHDNEITAAIDISGLSTQIFNQNQINFYIDETVKCAQKISEELGLNRENHRIVDTGINRKPQAAS